MTTRAASGSLPSCDDQRASRGGGYVYHVLNRGNGRMTIFDDEDDYAAFERVLAETMGDLPMRLLAYCLMPNHWHMLFLGAARDGRPRAVHAPADRAARAPLARASAQRGRRARVPGAVQDVEARGAVNPPR